MERLLFLDGKNYTDDLPELVRTAVRGIIFVDGKLLLIRAYLEEENGGSTKTARRVEAL